MKRATWILVLALGSCARSPAQAPLGAEADATDASVAADTPLPGFPSTCTGCHDPTYLTAHKPLADGTRAQWMGAKGRGLVREEPVFPTPGTVYQLPWPARGRHEEGDMGNCAVCHPYRPQDGLGHGLLGYPDVSAVFKPGGSCGSDCHGWLGSADRPEALLSGADNGHARIWLFGVRPKKTQEYRFAAFNPGCGGCHNVASENHGATAGCLDCHRMGGPGSPSHDGHVQVITQHQDKLDPAATKGAKAACAWCHTPELGETGRSRAACYGCHLSGHQPMDLKGKAHFWPVP